MREGYKASPVGVIPDDWVVDKVDTHIDLLTGFAFKSDGFSDDENDMRLLRGINVTEGSLRWSKEKNKYWRNLGQEHDKYFVDKGDLIISMDGSKVGRNYALVKDTDLPLVLVQRVARIKAKNKLVLKYLYHNVGSSNFTKYVDSVKTSSGIPHISSKQIKEFTIPLPPLPEQEKIASILTTVDDKIESIDKQIDSATELKKGLMQKLFQEGIRHTEFKDSPVGRIPAEWEVKKGIEITDKISKGASPKWQGFDYQEKGLLFITSENVRDGFLDISCPKFLPMAFNDKVKNSELNNGDILINIVGASIGRGCLYQSSFELANINQAVCLFRTNSEILPTFILYYLQEINTVKRLLNSQNGSARQNLSLADIKNFLFVIPPTSEQKQIADVLICADDKISVLKDKRSAYIELKKGLMQKLLTGEVRVKVDA